MLSGRKIIVDLKLVVINIESDQQLSFNLALKSTTRLPTAVELI